MLTALVLTAQLLSQVEEGDAPAAQVTTIPATPVEPEPAPAPVVAPATAAPERGVSLAAGPSTYRKSTNPLIAGLGVVAGALGGYLGLVGGVAINFSKGGLSDPLDSDDALLLMVTPAVGAAAFAWIVGLLDFSQRTFVGSAIWALLGAAIGEGAGLGLGYLLGRSMFPTDPGAQGLTFVAVGPAVAALGAVVFMELFKPGEEIPAHASISLTRDVTGRTVLGPAIGGTF